MIPQTCRVFGAWAAVMMLEVMKHCIGTLKLTGKAVLVTLDVNDALGFVMEALVGEADSGFGLAERVRAIELLADAIELVVVKGGLDGPEAAESPFGDGHLLNLESGHWIGRLESLEEALFEALKAFPGFAFDDDAISVGESVGDDVLGRAQFSFRRTGAGGLERLGRLARICLRDVNMGCGSFLWRICLRFQNNGDLCVREGWICPKC